MGILGDGITMVMILFFICIICILSIIFYKAKSLVTDHGFFPFYIQDETLIVNTFCSRQYPLSEISHVIIGFSRALGQYSIGSKSGYFRIVKTDGDKSAKFLFDGSVYTKRLEWFSSTGEIKKSIELVETELTSLGIRCVMIEN